MTLFVSVEIIDRLAHLEEVVEQGIFSRKALTKMTCEGVLASQRKHRENDERNLHVRGTTRTATWFRVSLVEICQLRQRAPLFGGAIAFGLDVALGPLHRLIPRFDLVQKTSAPGSADLTVAACRRHHRRHPPAMTSNGMTRNRHPVKLF